MGTNSEVNNLEGINNGLQFVFHLPPPPLVGPRCQSVELPWMKIVLHVKMT